MSKQRVGEGEWSEKDIQFVFVSIGLLTETFIDPSNLKAVELRSQKA